MKCAVVIPGYKRPDLLAETLRSVEAQTRPPDELILVDDGSDPPLEEVVAPFLERNPSWRYIYKENAGAATARNRGIEESSSDLIALLDADDLWEPEKLARHIERHESEPEVGLSFSACRFFSEERGPFKIRPETAPEGDVYREILGDSFISTMSSVVVHRRCFEACGLFDPSYQVVDDYHFYYRCARDFPFAFLPEPLVRYRCHDRNLSIRAFRKGHDERVRIFRELTEDPRPEVADLLRKKLAYYLLKASQDRQRDGDLEGAIAHVAEARALHPWSFKIWKYALLFRLKAIFAGG